MLEHREKFPYTLTIFDMIENVKNVFTNIIDGERILLNGDEIYFYMKTHLDSFFFTCQLEKTVRDVKNSDVEDAFKDCYLSFVSRQLENVKRIYLAYYDTEYNPLDNYDKKSTITTEYNGGNSNVKSGSESHNATQSGNIVNSQGAQHSVNTQSVSPENNNTFYNREKSDSTIDDSKHTTSFNNVQNNLTDTYNNVKDSFTYENRNDIVTERTSGNIGVTTSAQMLSGELQVRQFDIVSWFCKLFAAEELTANPPVQDENYHTVMYLEYP